MARLRDGFSTIITFQGVDPGGVVLWEKEISAPNVEGGGPINVTTMRNEEWRTKLPKTLFELGRMNLICAYDPALYNDVLAIVNVNNTATVTFPDKSQLTFFGWLDSFKPQPHKEGEEPHAEVIIECSNINPGTGEEGAPVYTPPP